MRMFLLKISQQGTQSFAFWHQNCRADDVDTVAGFVITGFTYLPEQMSEIDLQGFNFKVLKTDSRRLHLLEVTKINNK